MRAVLCLCLCLFLLFAIPGVGKVAQGYHFSAAAVVGHIKEFPVFPDLNWSGDFLGSAGALLGYGGTLFSWLTTFDPWEYGVPIYRDKSVLSGMVMVL